MLNPMAIELAQHIAEAFNHLLIEREKNVVTLEDTNGNRYLVTVETVFTATDEKPLPDPEA